MGDELGLIPAMDQNGLMVLIPPSFLQKPGSLFVPLSNVSNATNINSIMNGMNMMQPLPLNMNNINMNTLNMNINMNFNLNVNQNQKEKNMKKSKPQILDSKVV